jgi:nicotinamide mononucleotide adenylyltransferase
MKNLKKTSGMDTGQVSFVNERLVKRVPVATRINEVVNRLNKTKDERVVDYRASKVLYDREIRERERARSNAALEESRKEAKERQRIHDLATYKDFDKTGPMISNQSLNNIDYRDYEDNFL